MLTVVQDSSDTPRYRTLTGKSYCCHVQPCEQKWTDCSTLLKNILQIEGLCFLHFNLSANDFIIKFTIWQDITAIYCPGEQTTLCTDCSGGVNFIFIAVDQCIQAVCLIHLKSSIRVSSVRPILTVLTGILRA